MIARSLDPRLHKPVVVGLQAFFKQQSALASQAGCRARPYNRTKKQGGAPLGSSNASKIKGDKVSPLNPTAKSLAAERGAVPLLITSENARGAVVRLGGMFDGVKHPHPPAERRASPRLPSVPKTEFKVLLEPSARVGVVSRSLGPARQSVYLLAIWLDRAASSH